MLSLTTICVPNPTWSPLLQRLHLSSSGHFFFSQQSPRNATLDPFASSFLASVVWLVSHARAQVHEPDSQVLTAEVMDWDYMGSDKIGV